MIGTSTVDDDFQVIGNSTATAPAWSRKTALPIAGHPGRWLGGLAGAAASLIAAGVIHVFDRSDAAFLDLTSVALLGIPIGFALGRALWPQVRSGGWGHALVVGLAMGWIAPPLGAAEIVAGQVLLSQPSTTPQPLGWLLILPVAIPVSYLAIFITIPVGVAAAILARMIPTQVATQLRAPRPVERLGIRHVLAVVAVAGIVVQIFWAVTWPRG